MYIVSGRGVYGSYYDVHGGIICSRRGRRGCLENVNLGGRPGCLAVGVLGRYVIWVAKCGPGSWVGLALSYIILRWQARLFFAIYGYWGVLATVGAIG